MLFVYLLIAVIFRKHPIVNILSFIQVVSLGSVILIGLDDYSEDPYTFLNMVAITLLTSLFILPWSNYHKIKKIKTSDEVGVNKIADVMLYVGGFVFVILLFVAVIVNLLVSDINTFKYEDGASVDFFYKVLPFNVKFFILAYSLYYLSYFFIPLHFYFSSKGDARRSKLCLLFSFNIILYGLTFFSRWTIILYVLLFFVHWVIYSKLIPLSVRVKEKKVIKYFACFFLFIFFFITFSRFADNSEYENRMSDRTYVHDATLYSLFDYLGKSNSNGLYQMNRYQGETFKGGFMLWTLQDMLSTIGITNKSNVTEMRDDMWGDKARSFTPFAVYTFYDVGFVMSFAIALLCFVFIRQKSLFISFDKFIVTSLLIQLPLCSIFYSQMPVVVFCLFIYAFMKLYLYLRKISVRNSNTSPHLRLNSIDDKF